jgi:hypothetical protein
MPSRFIGRARRREQGSAEHADHDRDGRQVLVAPGVLAEYPLAQEQQHQQAGRERRLDNDQWRQQQSHHLERPAQDREPRAHQPAGAPEQSAHQRQPQVLLVRRLPGVHRLQGDP